MIITVNSLWFKMKISNQIKKLNYVSGLRSPLLCHEVQLQSNKVLNKFKCYSILFYPITLAGRRRTTDEFETILFHLVPFSAALVKLAKSIPVHSLILSPHLFLLSASVFFPFIVPCRIVFAKPEDRETWPNHLSFCFLTRVRSSSYSPLAAWIFLRTFSLVTWPLYEMFNSLR